MLQANTVAFLTAIAENNNKVWFDANRDSYQAAKEDFELFVGQLLEGLAQNDPAFAGQKPKDCIFRIFRDVRFGKDKTPYKPNFGAAFSKGGKKSTVAGFYVHIEPGGKNFIGGGLWQPDAPLLKKIRQEIDYNFEQFTNIVENKKFKKMFPVIEGEKLKKLPQGYTEDNPAIEYLKLKSFVVGHKLVEDKELTAKTLAKTCLDTFETMQPFIDFLNKGVE